MATSTTKLAAAAIFILGLLGGSFYFLHQEALAQAPSPGDPKDERVDMFGDKLPAGALARLGTLRWRHGGGVFFVAYSQDDKEMITASQDGILRVWEVATGKELRRFGKGVKNPNQAGPGPLPGNAAAVMVMPMNMNTLTSVTLSDDRKVLATSSNDGTITMYDVTEGKEIRNWKPNPQIYIAGLLFAPDGKTIVAKSNDPIIRQYDVENGKEVRKFGKQPDANTRIFFGGNAGNSMAFTPDGKTLISGAMAFENNMVAALIKRYEVESGKELEVIKGPQGGFQSLALAPDGKTVAWGGNDGTIRLWDLVANKEKHQLGNQGGYANALAFSPDGKLLVTRSYDQAIRVWDADNGKELRQLAGQEAQNANNVFLVRAMGFSTSNLTFSTSGKHIAAGTAGNTVRQWEAESGKELAQSAGHHGPVVTLGISPDGKTVATRAGENKLHLWDVSTGKPSRTLDLPAGVYHAVFSADGQTMALGSSDSTIRTFDVKAGKEIKDWKAAQGQNQVFVGFGGMASIAISPDGKKVAVRSYDQLVRTYDSATGKELRQMGEPPPPNPNGGFVYYGQPGPIVFSPDGSTIATMSLGQQFMGRGAAMPRVQNGSIQLFDVATGKQVRKFDTTNRSVSSLAFSPDGRTIATTNTNDNTISLWEATSGKERFNFKSAGQLLSVLAYAPDGRTLIGAGQDSVVHCYSVLTGKELAQFKGHQGPIVALALATDGKTLVSGSQDTTALVWATADVNKEEKPAPLELDADRSEALWKDLGGDDAKKAHEAILTLSRAPKQGVPLLQERVKAVPAPDQEKIKQLILDLEGDKPFAVRQRATEDLEKLGELAADALNKVLEEKPGLEMQMRIERLLERLVSAAAPPPDLLRSLRALEVLEHTGTAEARQAVESIAKGAPGAHLTRKAQETLNRMPKQ